MAKKVAGVLAGCGFLDGAEIQEAVLTLLALERRGLAMAWFAPDQVQAHVVDHRAGQPVAGESRNVLTESARIVRGAIQPLDRLDPAAFDALVLPGGFGAAKNLCSFAFDGAGMAVLPELERIVRVFHQARKPQGFICIAPVIAARVLGAEGARPRVTIGQDAATAEAIRSWGAEHVDCAPDGICLDERNRLVSTPAWNAADSIVQVAAGIDLLVERLTTLD
jgi:enhancing lycopene biosynthesis protein 2